MTNTDINSDEKQALYNSLVREVKEKVQKLKEYGMNEQEITSLIHTDQPILTLTIGKNYRIFLGDNRVEIHMEPLVKAVYLLFLNHPEGIVFKNLPDYRGELTKIYSEVRPWGLSERALQSIEDVTNPLLNSINEKCARIRKAFTMILTSSIAEYYYIKGKRGSIKSIILPRELVFWEQKPQGLRKIFLALNAFPFRKKLYLCSIDVLRFIYYELGRM